MEVDVAIVGGGPAGCSAALALRERGRSVVVISPMGGRKRPTETAAPTLGTLLRSMKAEQALDACEPCYGIASNWGRASSVVIPSILNPLGHGWFVHRSRFDTQLQELVRARGSTWINSTAQSAEIGEDCALVTASSGAEIRAKWVISATGSLSWSAKLTRQAPLTFDSMIALWAHLPGDFQDRSLSVETTTYGWWYICPADGAGGIACLVTDATTVRRLRLADPDAWLRLFLGTRLSLPHATSLTIERLEGARTGLAMLPLRTGVRWVAVGDAAVLLDPLGSSGTIHALESGCQSGTAISEALVGNMSLVEQYELKGQAFFQEFARQRRAQYLIETKLGKRDFWNRRLRHVEVIIPAPVVAELTN